MLYGDVIIDISLEKLDKTFQYEIPEHLRETVQIGSRVVIPFGNGKRRITGYVVDMSTEPKIDAGRIKPILGVSKDSIAVESQLIALAAWIRRNYGCTMNQALKTVIPIKKKEAGKEKKTVSFLLTQEQARDELSTLLARKRHSQAKEKLLRTLMERSTLPWEDITGKMQIPATVIRDFEKNGWVRIDAERAYRNPVPMTLEKERPIVLSPAQSEAVSRLYGTHCKDSGGRKKCHCPDPGDCTDLSDPDAFLSALWQSGVDHEFPHVAGRAF